VHHGDQVAEPAAPGLAGQQIQRHLSDVDRDDLASGRRGEQGAARRPAGQVGHRPVGQPQRQRAHRQRVRLERPLEAFIPGVPPQPVRVAGQVIWNIPHSRTLSS
jgi:hypothetical protein